MWVIRPWQWSKLQSIIYFRLYKCQAQYGNSIHIFKVLFFKCTLLNNRSLVKCYNNLPFQPKNHTLSMTARLYLFITGVYYLGYNGRWRSYLGCGHDVNVFYNHSDPVYSFIAPRFSRPPKKKLPSTVI